MEYIIDAYNLIKSSFLREHECGGCADRAGDVLFCILSDYRRKHPSVRFTAVFDGFPPSVRDLKVKGVRVLYSFDITADELIRKMLEKTPGGNRMKTVVSNDRGVQDCGRLFSCGVLGVEGFLRIVSPSGRKGADKPKKQQGKEVNRHSIEKELKDFYKS